MSAKIGDITGQRFGRWTALNPIKKRIQGCIAWKCRCDCGNIVSMSATQLTRGRSKSCGCLTKEIIGCRSRKDITGQRSGKLVAIESTSKRCGSSVIWKCRCDCGKISFVTASNIVNKHIKSCGCSWKHCRLIDITGQRFGKLVVLKVTEKHDKWGAIFWKCQCDCGNITFVQAKSLRAGLSKSCGCLRLAFGFAKGTNIDPMEVPLEIVSCMQARGKLRKAIKQAS